MDRRYFVAFLVSLLILLVYPQYLKWVGVSHSEKTTYNSPEPTLAPARPGPKEPVSAPSIHFHNNQYGVDFTTLGGNITLLSYQDVELYKSTAQGAGIFGLRILNESDDTSQIMFNAQPSTGNASGQEFVYEKAGEYRLAKKYFIANDRPSFVLEVELENLSQREKNFPLELDYGLELNMKDRRDEPKVKIVRNAAGDVHTTHLAAVRKKPLVTSESLEWQGLIEKYYALLVKPDSKLIGQETRLEDGRLISSLKFPLLTLAPGEKKQLAILVYAGPEHYETLKEFGVGFEKIFSSGTLGPLKVGLLKTLKFFYRLTRNYGVAILLLTLLIKILFTPFTHMSYQSMQKMQALQPKIKAVQKNFQNDPTRLNKEIMELYKRNRVNPMMGCLPLVLQIPIFISFYQVLSEAVELRGAEFVAWIRDLSSPDRLIIFPMDLPFIGNSFNLLPLIMIGSMVWQQALTPQTTADPTQAKMMYLMPIIFGFVFYNLPSGLVLYWIANNFLTIFHQLVIKKVPVILHHEDS